MKSIKPIKPAMLLAALLAAMAASPAVFAHGGGHVRFGFVFGGPVVAPWYYPPPVAVVPAAPPVYVEQGSAPAEWYYCAESRAYYPYVNACPGGWQRVAPQPGPNPG